MRAEATGIVATLRAGTRPHHERLERRLAVFDRIRSVDDYRALLAGFYGLYAPLEARLARVGGLDDVVPDLVARRRKTGALERDLLATGMDEAEVAAIPRCDALPDVEPLGRALGCMYVLEGATLGGQIITRHVRDTLGVDPEHGGAFFSSYGDRVGPMWREFCSALEAYTGRDDEILSGAIETFETFDAWLTAGG